MKISEYVIDKDNFNGHAKTLLYNGKCFINGTTKEDFIKQGYIVVDEDTYYNEYLENYLDNMCNKWKEITEEAYDEMLNVLPPLKWYNGGFFISEMWTCDASDFYQELNGKYYTSMQRLSYDRGNILNSLKKFTQLGGSINGI